MEIVSNHHVRLIPAAAYIIILSDYAGLVAANTSVSGDGMVGSSIMPLLRI